MTEVMIEPKIQTRLPYIDNLRAMIIIVVIMVHTAVTYSGLGSWYYVEYMPDLLDVGSKIFFGSFLALAQAFDMSFFFMVAGYFIPPSFDAKGPGKFMKDRLYRLGIPLLIYIFILDPIAVKLAYPEVNIINYFADGLKSLHFVGRTGPLWFVLALLIFTGIYTLLRMTSKYTISFKATKINAMSVTLLSLIITIPAFLIRIVMPMGAAFANLQFPYFSAYIVMFAVGVMAKRLELFDNVDYRIGKKWLVIAFSVGYLCFGLLVAFSGTLGGGTEIRGGLTWQSFAFCLWESFTCVAITIGLIGIFRNRFNRQNRLQKLLSENYFGVYVFHTPILIAISVSLEWLMIHPLLKFTLVAACAIAVSYFFTYLVRKINFMKSIFS